MRKIYVVGSMKDYANWMQGELTHNLVEADLVVFTGGEDVTPLLYGEPTGIYTSCSYQRDVQETAAFNAALALNKPMVGICRGSQLLCVLAGGRLVQHQANDSFIHPVFTSDGRELPMSSTHHQAQYPYDMNDDMYKVLAWTEGMLPYHWNGENEEISDKPFNEVEIAYYPKIKALGIQGHPEMVLHKPAMKETIAYLRDLLNKLLENKL